MALSDADVQKQIHQMMAFIEQEAYEKAEEIDARAEEEFAIEKGRLVNQNRLKIIEFYDRKEKKVELQKKIGASNLLNKSRLEILKAREQHIKNVLLDAHQQLTLVTQNKQLYGKLLANLISQGLCQLMEPKITLRCKEDDHQLVQSSLKTAVAQYQSLAKKDVTVFIDTDNWLPAEICGGVDMSAHNAKIKVSNTLESRLEMLSHQMLPEIRGILFGRNPNRKFDN